MLHQTNLELIATWLHDNGFSDEMPMQSANKKGEWAVILAAQQGRADVLASLLAQGAEINVVDAYGNNGLWAACFADAQDCAASRGESGTDHSGWFLRFGFSGNCGMFNAVAQGS